MTRSLPFSLAIIGGLLLLIVVFLVLVLRRAGSRSAKPSTEEGAEPSKGQKKASSIALKAGFYRALFRLRRIFSVRDFRYKVPWVLSLGTRPRAEGLLADSGVSLPFGAPPPGDVSGSRWWFCDGGVFLEVPGASSASPDGAATWNKVLGELVDHRPERPIDSLVLTVSSRELRSAREDPTGRHELEKSADALYERVWQAQQRLGLRFPIYLVVTDCESLPGFGQFSGRLREGLRRQIFGWSNPYSLDTTYRSDWVREAFGHLGERLRRILLEIFTERPPQEGADEMFLFPRQLRSLEDPLRRFADRVFKPSSYHEPMMLRGIFFAGGEGDVVEADEGQGVVSDLPRASQGGSGESGSQSFLLELIEQKIFPEGALAQPTAGRLEARSRSVRIAQAVLALTALVLGLGVWSAYSELSESNRILVPFLQKFSRDLAQVYTVRRQGLANDHDTATRRASYFAEGLSKIDISQYRSAFLPISWFDRVDGDLRQTIRIGFEQIIAEALRLDLEQAAARLLEESVGSRESAEIGIFSVGRGDHRERILALPIEQEAAFLDLRRFVEGLAKLDQNQRLFNSLRQRDGGELERLALLVNSLFRYELPQGFFENSGLYASALAGSGYEGFDPLKFRPDAESRFRSLSQSLDRALYEDSTLISILEELVEDLDGLRSGTWLRGDGRKAIHQVVDRLGEADDLVASAAVSWAFRKRFSLGAAYEETMTLAASTEFLDLPSEDGRSAGRRDVVREVLQASEAGWLGLRRRLSEARSDVTGPLLEQDSDENILPALSADLQVLHAALQQYRSERFLADRGRGGDDERNRQLAVPVPGGAVLRWDTIYLDQAIKLYEAYVGFSEGRLQEFPSGVREPLRLVARSGLYNQMTDFIRQAQTFAPQSVSSDPRLREEELRQEVELFQAAAPSLNRLLAILDDLQLLQARLQLEKMFLSQGAHFLAQIDGLLRARQLYQAQHQDFSWWNGDGNLAFESFGVTDEAALVTYLDLQREKIRYLGRSLAQPVVNSLGEGLVAKNPETKTLHLGWQEILVALADYDDKKPGNSVSSLENLIQVGMTKATPEDCAAVPAAVPRTGVRTDFFASRELNLRRGLYRRCREMTSDRALHHYAQVADFFNRHLAGRYPFVDPDTPGETQDADAEMVRRFFELFDPVAQEILVIPRSHPRFAGHGPEALAFVEQMREVQAFFKPFVGGLSGSPGEGGAGAPEEVSGAAQEPLAEVPTYDLRVEFRVNRDRELGANQIIRWSLGIEEGEISHRDPELSGRWVFGQSVRLALQWASDGPWVPLAPQDLPGAWVEGRTVVFERRGPWALLAFLQDFASPKRDFEGFEDPSPHTLKFQARAVPTAPTAATAKKGEAALEVSPEPVTVYVRVIVLAPGKNEPLRLPTVPMAAPTLPALESVAAKNSRGGPGRGA